VYWLARIPWRTLVFGLHSHYYREAAQAVSFNNLHSRDFPDEESMPAVLEIRSFLSCLRQILNPLPFIFLSANLLMSHFSPVFE
jgi:hypothetical protein